MRFPSPTLAAFLSKPFPAIIYYSLDGPRDYYYVFTLPTIWSKCISYFHFPFSERLSVSARTYSTYSARTEGGLVEHGGQRRLDDHAVRERRPCVAVALVSWKWQK